MLRADFSDQHVLSRDLGVPVRTYVGLDSRLSTGLLAGLTRIPRPPRLPRGLHLPGSDRWLVLARAANGVTRWAAGHRQSHATALITALAVRAATRLSPGVHHLHSVVTLDDVSGLRDIELGPAA
jgi:hypothetical protein